MESLPLKDELPTEQKKKLLRILGIGFGLAIVIGATIGVGILRTPGMVWWVTALFISRFSSCAVKNRICRARFALLVIPYCLPLQ